MQGSLVSPGPSVAGPWSVSLFMVTLWVAGRLVLELA